MSPGPEYYTWQLLAGPGLGMQVWRRCCPGFGQCKNWANDDVTVKQSRTRAEAGA